jgi:cyclase
MNRTLILAAVTALAWSTGPANARPVTPHPSVGAVQASEGLISLGPTTWLLTGQDGNVLLVPGPRGVLVVDDQRARSVPAVVAAAAGLAPGGITHAINTHWHLDHSGGNAVLAEAGAIIVAHRNVRERLAADQFMAAYNRTVPASPAIAWPSVVFDDGLTLHHGEEVVRIVHTPAAHTDGDALVHLERADVLHMGDLYFNGLFPFIDRSSGGTIDGLIAAIDVALRIAGPRTQVIPAHGELARRDDLVAWREMLATVRNEVAARKAAGQSLDEITAANLTGPFALGGDAARFVAAVYDSVPSAN